MTRTEFVTVSTTYNDPGWMQAYAATLVDEHLAACVNVLPMAQSVYRWEGKVQSEAEGVALIHTTRERAHELIEHIKQHHSYDEPQVLILGADAPTPGYAGWLRESVTK